MIKVTLAFLMLFGVETWTFAQGKQNNGTCTAKFLKVNCDGTFLFKCAVYENNCAARKTPEASGPKKDNKPGDKITWMAENGTCSCTCK